MRKQLVKNFGILIVMLGISDLLLAEDFSIELKTSPLTGALSELRIKGDKYNMNWLVKTDGTQYPWIKENYGWGLGYFTITKDRISIKYKRNFRLFSRTSLRKSMPMAWK